jgi:hypothetical protein
VTEITLSRSAIPAAALDIVQERVDRVRRRAERRGFPVPRLQIGERTVKKVRDTSMDEAYEGLITRPDPVYFEVEYVDVSIYASGPIQINGWLFIARTDPIEIDGEVTSIFARVPGTEDIPLPKWDKAPDACDHCGLRRRRNETFILARGRQHATEDEDGGLPPSGVHSEDCRWLCDVTERVCDRKDHALCDLCGPDYKQVGRQCVRDFIGYDPDAMIAAVESFGSLAFDEDEIRGWAEAAPRMFPVKEELRAAAAAVLMQGFYVSKKKANETLDEAMADGTGRSRPLAATGDVVRFLLTPPRTKQDREEHAKYAFPPDKVDEVVDATYEGLERIKEKWERSEWEDNVLLVVQAERIPWKHVGVTASAILVGWRQLDRQAQAKVAAAEQSPSVHIGTVGDKYEAEVIIERVIAFDNDFGGSWLVKMRAPEGNVQWWASRQPAKVDAHYDTDRGEWVDAVDYQTGDRVKIKGRIKGHDIDRFNQQPVTVLTRCRIELVPEPVASPPPVFAQPEREPDDLPF